MHPLTTKFLGSSGLQCYFATDDSGTVAVGYFLKQIGSNRFIVTNGTATVVCALAQTDSDIAGLPTSLPANMCSLVLQTINSMTEHVRYITANRCSTIEGNTYAWHTDDPTAELVQIIIPTVQSQNPFQVFEFGALQTEPPVVTTEAYAVSDEGLVVGTSTNNNNSFGWVTSDNNFAELPGLEGSTNVEAFAITSDGEAIYGIANDADGNNHLIVWAQGGSVTDLGYQSSQQELAGLELSTRVVCASTNPIVAFTMRTVDQSTTYPAIYTQDGGISDLPRLPGAISGTVGGISPDGSVVVGNSDDGTTTSLYVWNSSDPTNPISAGTFITGEMTMGTAVAGDNETVFGWGYTADASVKAFQWRQDTGFVDIGGLPGGGAYLATCVIDAGIIVGGIANDADGNTHGVVWTPDGILQLPEAPDGTTDYQVTGISHGSDLIVGYCTDTDGNVIAVGWSAEE